MRRGHQEIITMILHTRMKRHHTDSGTGIPQSPEQKRLELLLQSFNSHVQRQQPTSEKPQVPEWQGAQRNFVWIDAVCIKSG